MAIVFVVIIPGPSGFDQIDVARRDPLRDPPAVELDDAIITQADVRNLDANREVDFREKLRHLPIGGVESAHGDACFVKPARCGLPEEFQIISGSIKARRQLLVKLAQVLTSDRTQTYLCPEGSQLAGAKTCYLN